MRTAEPNELTTHAYPVMTAAVSESELAEWFPVPLQHITDPQEAAEPTKAALIKLDTGEPFVLYYGELSNQLMLRIPTSTDASTFLSALLREVPLPRTRIIWRRQDARVPEPVASDLIEVISTYNDMFEGIYGALESTVGADEVRAIFAMVLDAANDELWTGVSFDESGRLDEQTLLTNVARVPPERRRAVLGERLITLLTMELFEVLQHLDAAAKVDLLRFISDRRASREKATA
jgi:hypothetical protein